jgi:hypothetical protein
MSERIDEIFPRRWRRMRRIALPIEDLVVGRLHGVRCEPQFDKWLDATREQIIVELVYFGPVVGVLAVFDSHRAQYIAEDRMETNVAEAEFIDRSLELCLAVVANERAGIVGALPTGRRTGRAVWPQVLRRGLCGVTPGPDPPQKQFGEMSGNRKRGLSDSSCAHFAC